MRQANFRRNERHVSPRAVCVREGVGEASVMGRLLSIESSLIGSAEAVVAVEGNTGWTAKVRDAPRCQRTHARTYRPGRAWSLPGDVGKEKAVTRQSILITFCLEPKGGSPKYGPDPEPTVTQAGVGYGGLAMPSLPEVGVARICAGGAGQPVYRDFLPPNAVCAVEEWATRKSPLLSPLPGGSLHRSSVCESNFLGRNEMRARRDSNPRPTD